ncbi:MAG TPA: hypothetical protein PK079_00685 [Leptospiraceae bacterium]|nr:hypothetical protein [Leptospiraceae bacterium]HMW03973.1 hypothetical protein [Leptospiraceae bacterium]HMX33611.1 hypothetical protein [Leptospiraceae bacterium]HMY29953.1 hypothetical protein [Leptospiraceae bacterium]HMZ66770.1 hypothetical protein [Leptospiraceae bacterium]
MPLEERVSLKLTKELYAKVENEAKKDKRSVNSMITIILEKFFAKKKSD